MINGELPLRPKTNNSIKNLNLKRWCTIFCQDGCMETYPGFLLVVQLVPQRVHLPLRRRMWRYTQIGHVGRNDLIGMYILSTQPLDNYTLVAERWSPQNKTREFSLFVAARVHAAHEQHVDYSVRLVAKGM